MATPDQACHFRHCVRLYSGVTNQSLYLTSDVSGSQDTGQLYASAATDKHWNQHFWLLTDRPGSNDEPGVGYLCDTFVASVATDPTRFHAVACAAQSGAHPSADHTTPNSYDAAQQWEFVVDSVSSLAIVIRKPGTSLCITAGASPSDTLSSSSVQCSLTTYSGAANQRWYLAAPWTSCNVFQLAPAADPAMAIATPGQISQDGAELGIVSYDETDPTAAWMGWYESYAAMSRAFMRWTHYVSPSQEKTASVSYRYTYPPSGRLTQRVEKVPQDNTSFTPGSLLDLTPTRTYAGGDFTTRTGTEVAAQYSIDDSDEDYAVSSSDGEITIAASPWIQALSTSTGASNAAQFWYAIPRNFYNPGMPTPYDLQLICHDDYTGTEWVLEASDELDSSHRYHIMPRFICDWDAFSVVLLARFRGLSSTTWSDWEVRQLPASGNSDQISGAPWSVPDGPPAWVPNAWSTGVDDDGYRQLTQSIDLGGLLSDHPCEVMQISVTLRAFEYGPSYRYPWAPYQGPGSTVTSIIAPRPTISPSSAYVSDDGLHISYTSSAFPGAGQCSLRMRSLRVIQSGSSWSRELLASSYEVPLYQSSGTFIVPMTAFDGEAIIDVVELFQSTSSLTLEIAGDVVTSYAAKPLTSSITLDMESGADVLPSWTVTQTELGQWATRIVIRFGWTWTTSYQLISSESDTSLMQLKAVDSSERLARHMVGQSLSTGTSSHVSLIFGRDDSDVLAFLVLRTTVQNPRPVASLSWVDAAGIVHLIPVQGDLSFSYSSSKRVEAAQRLGATRFIAGTSGGSTPSLKFSGTIFRDELSEIPAPASGWISFDTSVSDLYRIPDDVDVLFRTTYGTAYLTRIVKVDSPRNSAGQAQITIEMLEVEPS